MELCQEFVDFFFFYRFGEFIRAPSSSVSLNRSCDTKNGKVSTRRRPLNHELFTKRNDNWIKTKTISEPLNTIWPFPQLD